MIGINFQDSLLNTTLSIEYHLPPKGKELFNYSVSQFNSSQKDKKEVVVAGNKAIEAKTIISKDGKGNLLNPSLRLIVVDFLDKQKTGEFQFQFKTQMPDDVETEKFHHVLSTFSYSK